MAGQTKGIKMITNKNDFVTFIEHMLDEYDKRELTRSDFLNILATVRVEVCDKTIDWLLNDGLKDKLIDHISFYNPNDFTPYRKERTVIGLERANTFMKNCEFELLIHGQQSTHTIDLYKKVTEKALKEEAIKKGSELDYNTSLDGVSELQKEEYEKSIERVKSQIKQ